MRVKVHFSSQILAHVRPEWLDTLPLCCSWSCAPRLTIEEYRSPQQRNLLSFQMEITITSGTLHSWRRTSTKLLNGLVYMQNHCPIRSSQSLLWHPFHLTFSTATLDFSYSVVSFRLPGNANVDFNYGFSYRLVFEPYLNQRNGWCLKTSWYPETFCRSWLLPRSTILR